MSDSSDNMAIRMTIEFLTHVLAYEKIIGEEVIKKLAQFTARRLLAMLNDDVIEVIEINTECERYLSTCSFPDNEKVGH